MTHRPAPSFARAGMGPVRGRDRRAARLMALWAMRALQVLRPQWARLLWLPLLLLATGPVAASDDDAHDHDRARAAVQSGQVLPLQTVLARLRLSHPGEVLEVELEDDHGRWRYEIKLLQPDGALRKLKVDARSGEVLQRPGRHAGRPAEPALAPAAASGAAR